MPPAVLCASQQEDALVREAITKMGAYGSLPETSVIAARLKHLCTADAEATINQVLFDMQMSGELITVGECLILNRRYIPAQRRAS
jgi:hypothetical protein